MSGTYDYRLVALSLIVAALASYTALDLAGRVRGSQGAAARGWLVGGSVAMGSGIWSMHFIGMLAFSLPVALAYDFWITIGSLALAILGAGIALSLASRDSLEPIDIGIGGLVMGLSICGMHYTGMAAMKMAPAIRYEPLLFGASVAVAIGASMAALWLAFTLRAEARSLIPARLAASGVMGLAISGMHYIGMSAAQFAPGALCLASGRAALGGSALALWVGALIIAVLILTLLGSEFDSRRARRKAETLAQLETINRELRAEISAREMVQQSLQKSAAEQLRLAEELSRRSTELERSNRELEQFAYVASHDLQAPLRTVVSFVQLLGRRLGPAAEPQVQEYLNFITDATRQMHGLVQALLEISRVGRDEMSIGPVQLDAVLDRVKTALHALIEERHAVIESETLPVVQGDAALLTQLLQNLISNAIKFQPRQVPRVRVRSRLEDGQWTISVQDHGIGIEPRHQQRIFQIFQRLHPREHFDGHGIGLAICQKIVSLHRGRIWLESIPGEGSTFHFTIGTVLPA